MMDATHRGTVGSNFGSTWLAIQLPNNHSVRGARASGLPAQISTLLKTWDWLETAVQDVRQSQLQLYGTSRTPLPALQCVAIDQWRRWLCRFLYRIRIPVRRHRKGGCPSASHRPGKTRVRLRSSSLATEKEHSAHLRTPGDKRGSGQTIRRSELRQLRTSKTSRSYEPSWSGQPQGHRTRRHYEAVPRPDVLVKAPCKYPDS